MASLSNKQILEFMAIWVAYNLPKRSASYCDDHWKCCLLQIFVYKICCFRLHLVVARNAEKENNRYGNIWKQIILGFFFIAHATYWMLLNVKKKSQIQEKPKQIYSVFVSSRSLNVR